MAARRTILAKKLCLSSADLSMITLVLALVDIRRNVKYIFTLISFSKNFFDIFNFLWKGGGIDKLYGDKLNEEPC